MEHKYFILFNNKTTISYTFDEIKNDNNIISTFLNNNAKDIGVHIYESNDKIGIKISDNSTITVSINGKTIKSAIYLSHNDIVSFKYQTKLCYLLFINDITHIRCSCVKIQNNCSLHIGRGVQNNIIINHPAVLENQAEIVSIANNLTLKSASASYTYVNSVYTNNIDVVTGDYIQILNCIIYIMEDLLYVIGEYEIDRDICILPWYTKKSDDSLSEFTPVPRIYRTIDDDRFVIEPPPVKNNRKPIPFILSAGPSLTMSLAMLVSTAVSVGNVINYGMNGTFITSSFMALSMLAGALLWPWLMRKYNEKQDQETEQIRINKYRNYLLKKEEDIQQIYNHNLDILIKYKFPSISHLSTAFDNATVARFLWEREINDDDFLVVRLGCGYRKSNLSIQISEPKFSLDDDTLANLPGQIAERFSGYDTSPISLSISNNRFIGIFGKTLYTDIVIHSIIMNITLLHPATKVKTVYLFNNKIQAVQYNYLSDIPHIWNQEKNRRYLSYNDADTESILTYIYNKINAPDGSTMDKSTEYYVIFVWDKVKVENTSLYQYVSNIGEASRVSFIYIAEKYATLPQNSSAVVQCSKDLYGIYIKNQNDNRLITFQPDEYDIKKATNTIKKLCLLKYSNFYQSDILPSRVSFLDLYKAADINALNISSRWQSNNSHFSLAVPIGVIKGGEVIQFDIHESFHGCHGIVAGTTGSGKSEFLQSYILSLMVNYNPDDVNFVLIDFKGGDIASPFAGLPHLSAVISNLSKNILLRAMISLEAEQIKRQRIFEEKKRELNIDKIDINSYQKLYHSGIVSEPLPHLIIIMDEFAQFKTQHGEYMQKLINIAQIGRSLGIHLILATQKPAGVVDGQIWSNSRFKFCLKVLEREDSKAVLQRDEAAFIKNPGTGYMQVGYNEIFSLFQAGYCRAKYIPHDIYCSSDELTVQMIDETGNILAEETDIPDDISINNQTQLSAVVDELHRVSNIYNYKPQPLWLPEMGNYVYSDDCDITTGDNAMVLPLGMIDIPTEQKQLWYMHNFITDGNIAVYGASGTGKTTFIQSVLYQAINKYTEKHFKYCIIDVGSKGYSLFVNTSYDIGSVVSSDSEQIGSVINNIQQELAYRKDIFTEIGCNSFVELHQIEPNKLPIILIVLENYARFREIAYEYEDKVIDIVSSGQSYGIYFIITTNSKSGIYYKVREQLSKIITFNMSDVEAYRDILGVKIDIEPMSIKGRALILYNAQAVELQIALPIKNTSESIRLKIMKQYLQQYRTVYDEPIGYVNNFSETKQQNSDIKSSRVVKTEVLNKSILSHKVTSSLFIGFDSERHIPLYIDIYQHKRLFICSENNSDFSQAIDNLICELSEYRKWVIDGNEGDTQKIILSEIEECISKDIIPIVIISNFISFYNKISNENLDKLSWFIKNHIEPVYITCSTLNGFSNYSDTSLHSLLCKKASVIMFTDGILHESDVNILNNYIYSIDRQLLKKKYMKNHYLISVDDEYIDTYYREV